MSVTIPRPQAEQPEERPEQLPLEPGDHLDRETFHARYLAMQEDRKAELVGGVVYMASPVKRLHGRHTRKVGVWLDAYETATPGVEGFDNVTVILGDTSELQPDACLLINPEYGGQAREEDGYIAGAPELVVEVAFSSASYDLHSKKRDYERAGVREYVVVLTREPAVNWFVLREGAFVEMAPGPDGFFRSEVFPGLWLDPAALLRLDSAALLAVLQQGLASDEHGQFVAGLAAAKKRQQQ